jgi:hypothetical protein
MERECVARVKYVKALDVAFLDQRIPRYERDIIWRRPRREVVRGGLMAQPHGASNQANARRMRAQSAIASS